MRAFRLPALMARPEWQDVPKPTVGPGQVLVKVAAVGLCQSDLFIQRMTEVPSNWKVPFTLGHEITGHVAALGTGVDGLKIGEAVAMTASPNCGRCWYCVRGESTNCEHSSAGRGFGDDGGLADYVLVKTPLDIISLGDLDPVTAAPLTDAGACAFHGVNRVRGLLGADSTAVVFGAGGLGSFAIQFLRALTPAQVIVVVRSPEKRALALELGAHEALAGVDDTTLAAIRARTGGRGADAIFDFVGIDQTVNTGVAAVRPGGSYVLIGADGGRLTTPGGWYDLLPKDGQVFAYEGSNLRDAQSVFALARRGVIQSLVEVFPADQVEEAYRRLEEGSLRGRAVITMG